jgi:hypothetical protein
MTPKSNFRVPDQLKQSRQHFSNETAVSNYRRDAQMTSFGCRHLAPQFVAKVQQKGNVGRALVLRRRFGPAEHYRRLGFSLTG